MTPRLNTLLLGWVYGWSLSLDENAELEKLLDERCKP